MSTYDNVAKQYSDSMGEKGDYYHRTQIDPMLYKMIGSVKDKIVYDIGCGDGYIARKFAKEGASVTASDISKGLIKIAHEKSKELSIIYSIRDATDFSGFADEQFDVVTMNMVLHYIEDLDKLFREVSRVLKKGGIFAFTTNHFLRPNYPYSEWLKEDLNGKETLFIKVTGYLTREIRKGKCWLDNKTDLVMYNQTLGDLVNTMAKYHLYTFHVEEPEGDGFAHDYPEELRNSHHIPTYIGLGAKKFEHTL